jgi:hypothetical protein
MKPPLSKDTRLCISLAARPGNIGAGSTITSTSSWYRYEQLDLDFIYKAFTTTDIAAGVGGVRALGIRGKFFSSPVRMTAARARSAGLMPTLGGTYIKNGVKRLIAQRRW